MKSYVPLVVAVSLGIALIATAYFLFLGDGNGGNGGNEQLTQQYNAERQRQSDTCYQSGGIPRYSAWDGRYLECTPLHLP
jgi:hypothetical protein